MNKTMKSVLSGALLITIAACGGDDSDDSPDSGPGIDASADAPIQSTALDPICNETDGVFVQLFARAFECNPFFELFAGEVTDASLSAVCYGSFQPFIDDGTVTVSGNAADLATCANYAATDCVEFDLDILPCDDILVGTVAAAGDCDTTEQCVAGNYCDTSGAGCGSCAGTLANAVACNESDDCTSGYCNEAGVCATKGSIGDACGADEDCLGQLPCDTGNTGLCVALPVFAVDDVCDDQNFIACGFPFSGLFCGSTDLCVAEVDIGQTCDSVDTRCHTLDFEWCDNGLCAAPAAAIEGAACGIGFNTQANKCNSGLICTDPFGAGVCVSPQEVGETCVDTEGQDLDNECRFFLSCVDGTCAESEHTGMCPAP